MSPKRILAQLFKEFGEGKAAQCEDSESSVCAIRLKGSCGEAALVWSYTKDPHHCDSLTVHVTDPKEKLPAKKTWFSDVILCRLSTGSVGVELRIPFLEFRSQSAFSVARLVARAAALAQVPSS